MIFWRQIYDFLTGQGCSEKSKYSFRRDFQKEPAWHKQGLALRCITRLLVVAGFILVRTNRAATGPRGRGPRRFQ